MYFSVTSFKRIAPAHYLLSKKIAPLINELLRLRETATISSIYSDFLQDRISASMTLYKLLVMYCMQLDVI